MVTSFDWLSVQRGEAPLVLSLPHTGTCLPAALETRMTSPWLARKDTDWWIDTLYDFAGGLGATVIRTALSRTAIDVNRDPAGVSLYPGQATTELCPTTTFDGEPLYRSAQALRPEEIAGRRAAWFDPYHDALDAEIVRLRQRHARIVVYDGHAIRSVIPRLFGGTLPVFNIGTNGGASCAPALSDAVAGLCAATGHPWVLNGRFRGGFITRRLGRPAEGVHAIQMELACRGYMQEPLGAVDESTWPGRFEPAGAAAMRDMLVRLLTACLAFAHGAS